MSFHRSVYKEERMAQGSSSLSIVLLLLALAFVVLIPLLCFCALNSLKTTSLKSSCSFFIGIGKILYLLNPIIHYILLMIRHIMCSFFRLRSLLEAQMEGFTNLKVCSITLFCARKSTKYFHLTIVILFH